ncbi:methyl-accepting chemotaxis protein [Gammaproteobacteria bacterium]
MFKNLSLWTKILSVVTLALLGEAVLLTFSGLHNLNAMMIQIERRELEGYVAHLIASIASETRLARALSTLVASLPLIQEPFAANDREALKAQTLATYQAIKAEFGVEQFQFHTPPAQSYLRLHMPEKFGDDLSSFRHTVVHTNETRQATEGLEGGVAGLGLRGMVPVFHKDKHLGSVEFGMSFGRPFFDAFKADHGVDTGLHLPVGDRFKTFASTLGQEPLMSSESLIKALRGEGQFEYHELLGKVRAVYAGVVNDYSGKPLGVLEVSMDRGYYQSALENARAMGYVAGLAALGLGLLLAWITGRGLAHRIEAVSAGVRRISQGDLTTQVAIVGQDEIGQLAGATQTMQRQLHDLVAQVRDHAFAVHAAAREIAASVESQAGTSSEMSASVAEITSTMEEFSASSNQIAEYSKSVVEIAHHTWENSRQGADGMQMLMNKMTDIRADNQRSLQEIVDLGRNSKEIGKVMEIINAVADQTRLIAFNAALEASSAGEAGRRFSVVAAEIRRLADNVTESTGEIEKRVNEIQNAISRLVIASEKGSSGIEAGLLESARTGERLSQLVDAAHQSTSAAQQISLSTQQQQVASDQVVVALREIVAASSHTAQSISRVLSVSKDMASLSAELNHAVGQFKVD